MQNLMEKSSSIEAKVELGKDGVQVQAYARTLVLNGVWSHEKKQQEKMLTQFSGLPHMPMQNRWRTESAR